MASAYSTSFATYGQCPSITPEMERKVKLTVDYINKFDLNLEFEIELLLLSIYVTLYYRNMHSRQCV